MIFILPDRRYFFIHSKQSSEGVDILQLDSESLSAQPGVWF